MFCRFDMPARDKKSNKRAGSKSDEVKPKHEKKTSLKAKTEIEKKRKEEVASSKIIRTRNNPPKEESEKNTATIKVKTVKKVPFENKHKDLSIKKSNMRKVLNGSLSKKRTGDIYLGFHASSSGGVHNAIRDSVSMGARSLALFLRPQRSWTAPPLKPDAIEKFKKIREEEQILPNMILPHGSYLLNLGSPNATQRQKSLDTLVDELERCQVLGILLFNIHPGLSCVHYTILVSNFFRQARVLAR